MNPLIPGSCLTSTTQTLSMFSQQHTGVREIPHLCQELRTLSCGKAKAELGATWTSSFAFTGSAKKVSKLDSPFSLPCPSLTDKSGQGEGHWSLLPHSKQEHSVLGELESHAGCCACSFTWWETTDPSAAGLSSSPCRANVTQRTPLAISCTPTPHSHCLLLMQVLELETTLNSGHTKSSRELETLWTFPATRIIVILPICSGTSSLQEMVWS